MKRILIVGSTSTVGRAIGQLLARQHQVCYAGRRGADYPLDLEQEGASMPAGLQFDVVLHAAADFGGPTDADLYRAEKVNALGTLTVCRLASAVGATQLVLLSSSFAGYQPGQANFNSYALSKRHAEELAQLYCATRPLALAILRPTQLYDAAGACRRHQRLLYALIDHASRSEDCVFQGGHDALRNYLFLDDFTEIVRRVVDGGLAGRYACPAPESVRLSQIAASANRVFGGTGAIRFEAGGAPIPDLPAPSGGDLYRLIKFTPGTALQDGMAAIRHAREAA